MTRYLLMQLTKEQAVDYGYRCPKILSTGECAGVRPMVFTAGLFVGLDRGGYRTRFCYESFLEATIALNEWDGMGDPPGNWIKEKGMVERDNPRRIATESQATKI